MVFMSNLLLSEHFMCFLCHEMFPDKCVFCLPLYVLPTGVSCLLSWSLSAVTMWQVEPVSCGCK